MKRKTKKKIETGANGTGQQGRSSYRNWMGSLTLVALLAIFIGFWQYSETLIGTIDRQAGDLAEARVRMRTLSGVLDIVGSANVRLHLLMAAGNSSLARGKVFWNTETHQAALQIDHLPPADKPYQLWIVENKKPLFSRPFTVGERDTSAVWRVLTFDRGAFKAESFMVATGAGDSTQPYSVILASPVR